MKRKLFRSLAGVALVALAGLGTTAQARDGVFWSLGIEAAPGVSVGVSNTRPVIVAPAPVYVAPQPVYVAPRPVYVAPRPIYLAPRPVVLVEQPVYVHPGRHRGWHKHGHHRH